MLRTRYASLEHHHPHLPGSWFTIFASKQHQKKLKSLWPMGIVTMVL